MPEEHYLIGKVTHPMFTPEGVTLFLKDGRRVVFGASLKPHTRNFISDCDLFIHFKRPLCVIFAYTAEGKRVVNFTTGEKNCMIIPQEPANGADAAATLLKETEQTTSTYLCDGCKRLVPQHQRHQCPSQSYAVQA